MNRNKKFMNLKKNLNSPIKLLLTDSDGVLTDTGVYYSHRGEIFKKFSIRDGMGVERLKTCCDIEVGIITGEKSASVKMRAKKLKIKEIHLGVKNKLILVKKILERKKLQLHELAYIGDDYNDLDVIGIAGFSACPADAVLQVKKNVHYICQNKGGEGAFREFCEKIISLSKYNK